MAKFWGPRYRDDVDPNWLLMTDAWMPWRDYLVVFLRATQKFFEDVDVESINSYKFTCLCSMFLCYKLIVKAGFAEESVAWHWGWIDACQALIDKFDQVRRTRMNEEIRAHQEETEQQCRERYRQSAFEQLEEEIQQNGWLNVPADPGLLFDGDLEGKYGRALKLLGIDPARLSGEAGHA